MKVNLIETNKTAIVLIMANQDFKKMSNVSLKVQTLENGKSKLYTNQNQEFKILLQVDEGNYSL